MTTASTSQSFTITSNDNVINARLLKDKEIADKEAALNLKREKKMALLERRRQEAFDALE